MSQHFLLSAKARTLSLARVMRMSDAEALETFMTLRWADNQGKPVCPHCGCTAVYTYTKPGRFRCKACTKKFSVTSGTLFASHKMSLRDILAAIAIFVNAAKGYSALQLSRDLNCQYKTAFVLSHKIREALGQVVRKETIEGQVEVDGAFFGGYVKPANYKENRRDRRLLRNQTGKRQAVVIMRERNGNTLPAVFRAEDEAVPTVLKTIKVGSTVFADEAAHWDVLHSRFQTRRVNHSQAYSHAGACTNMAESFFSRLRRAEIGTHHHISGRYLGAYAFEMAWREDNRRVSNGGLYLMAAHATIHAPMSLQWRGYWNRTR